MFLFANRSYALYDITSNFVFDSSYHILFAAQTVMSEGATTKPGNSFSEKQNRAVTRTEVDENSVAQVSGAKRHVVDEQDSGSDSQCHFMISSFAWH